MKKGSAYSADTSLAGFYFIGVVATIVGILVIFLLNIATPLEFVITQMHALKRADDIQWAKLIFSRLLIFCMIALFACIPFLVIMRKVLSPISRWLKQMQQQQPISPQLDFKARRRLINLPFLMVPVVIGLWGIIPLCFFGGAFAFGIIDSGTAITFALRSLMVGFISSAIIFFGLESHARKTLIPVFFPKGKLTQVNGTAKISISRRIRAFYRIGSLIPLANIVLTLFILYWQVDSNTITAKVYGRGVFIFSIVVFILFFMGSGILNRLISRSISDPLDEMLLALREIEKGDLDTQVNVVSNDEVGILGDAANKMIQGLKEKELMRDAFGKYVAPEVRDEIISGRIPLDGEYKEVTILFADLKDFTPMTESHDPKLVVRILNDYFKEMSSAIEEQSGLILQFLGDEIYAVFGAPIPCEDHAEKAFSAALGMKKRLETLNHRFASQGRPTLYHGIGIHTGQVVAANIGSPKRLSYLLVGDTVNLASRLQSLTRELDAHIIVSSDTVERLPVEQIQDNFLKHSHPVQVKGRQLEVDIYLIPRQVQ